MITFSSLYNPVNYIILKVKRTHLYIINIPADRRAKATDIGRGSTKQAGVREVSAKLPVADHTRLVHQLCKNRRLVVRFRDEYEVVLGGK